jgi:site-specific recombinase XerD
VTTDNVIPFTSARPRPRSTPRSASQHTPRPATRRRSDTAASGTPLETLIESWELSLQARDLSDKTIRSYTDTAKALSRFLDLRGLPADSESVHTDHIRLFLIHERKRTSAASAGTHFRNLSVWFNWIIKEKERTGSPSPVDRADKPQVTRKTRRYLSDEDIRALLKTCAGDDFINRRDTAIIRILADNGARVSGLAGIRYTPHKDDTNDVFLRQHRLRIRLKGGNERLVPFGAKAATALDRYLRARAKHPRAGSPWLWLGVKGRSTLHMTDSGIRQMLDRRGQQAGIPGVHPHRFRGTAAHELLAAGASEGTVMRVLGWTTRDMVDLYTEELADQRAFEAHARLSPGDRI